MGTYGHLAAGMDFNSMQLFVNVTWGCASLGSSKCGGANA
jgi:hypothetical protein